MENNQPQLSWTPEDSRAATKTLQELDMLPDEVATLAPIVLLLEHGHPAQPSVADTQSLLAVLQPHISLAAQHPCVRQLVHERYAGQNRVTALLAIARTQVNILRPIFWLLSAAIMVLGALVELGSQQGPHNDAFVFYLRALCPLLAYFSIAFAFRGVGLYTLEWELGCPPSALQLIVARLVIVLGYDVCLGFGLSVVAWAHGSTSLLTVTLYWLTPLLLVAGAALVLSQWLSAQRASLLAYTGWLALLLLLSFPYTTTAPGITTLMLSVGGEVTLSLAGMALLLIAVWRLVERVPQLLLSPPH